MSLSHIIFKKVYLSDINVNIKKNWVSVLCQFSTSFFFSLKHTVIYTEMVTFKNTKISERQQITETLTNVQLYIDMVCFTVNLLSSNFAPALMKCFLGKKMVIFGNLEITIVRWYKLLCIYKINHKAILFVLLVLLKCIIAFCCLILKYIRQ